MRWYLFFIVIAAASLLVFWRLEAYKKVNAHQVVRTRSDLVVVEDAIKLLDALDPKAILQLSGSNNVNAFILFNMLSSTNEDVPLLQSRSDWKARGAVLDRWGSPIRIKVTILRENPRITSIELRSIGPNKLDENGLGDDIVNPEFVLKGVTH